MSKDDIIKNWKGSKQTQSEDNPPANPVGESELPDAALESVAGGTDFAKTDGQTTVGCCTTSLCPTGKLAGCPEGAATFD